SFLIISIVLTLLLFYPLIRLAPSLFFFNATLTTEIYTLSLHDALPISDRRLRRGRVATGRARRPRCARRGPAPPRRADDALDLRSEEHTSELQSRGHLVCRLLLEKKKDRR